MLISNHVKKITVIPAIKKSNNLSTEKTLENVCAYCRVSTDNEEQESSYDLQVKYYTEFIKSKQDWNLIDIYADDGISGKSAFKRPEFMRMINDCIAGKIDRILTKSISRFARNTRECLKYVRLLKENNIRIIFEKEGLDTMSSNSDFVLTLLSSIAEEESRSISTNVKWSFQKKYEDGIVTINTKNFLGYSKDENKNIIINNEEAKTIRRIYQEFLNGLSLERIAEDLTKDKIKTASGKEIWYKSTVQSILSNEKYKGDAILQKSYITDFLSKRKKNNGEVKSYYVENSHPAIINRDMFESVQSELKHRNSIRSYTKNGHGRYSGKYVLSGKVICGDCGSKYRRHNQISGGKDKKRIIVWVCINHQESKSEDCKAKPIRDDIIKSAFIDCMKEILLSNSNLIKQIKSNIENNLNDNVIEEISNLQKSLAEKQNMLFLINNKYINSEINDIEYFEKNKNISDNIVILSEKIENLHQKCNNFKLKKYRIEELISILDQKIEIENFNEFMFQVLIDKVVVTSKRLLEFVFKCGYSMKKEIALYK